MTGPAVADAFVDLFRRGAAQLAEAAAIASGLIERVTLPGPTLIAAHGLDGAAGSMVLRAGREVLSWPPHGQPVLVVVADGPMPPALN